MPLPTFRILPPSPAETSPISDHSPSPSSPISMRSVSRNTTLTLSVSLSQISHQADDGISHSSLTPPLGQPRTHICADRLPTPRCPPSFGHPLERCPRNASSSQLACLPFTNLADLPPQPGSISPKPAQKKKGGWVKCCMKRFVRFLFHSDGGKTDSRGLPIFEPYAELRRARAPARARVRASERPVFREVNCMYIPEYSFPILCALLTFGSRSRESAAEVDEEGGYEGPRERGETGNR